MGTLGLVLFLVLPIALALTSRRWFFGAIRLFGSVEPSAGYWDAQEVTLPSARPLNFKAFRQHANNGSKVVLVQYLAERVHKHEVRLRIAAFRVAGISCLISVFVIVILNSPMAGKTPPRGLIEALGTIMSDLPLFFLLPATAFALLLEVFLATLSLYDDVDSFHELLETATGASAMPAPEGELGTEMRPGDIVAELGSTTVVSVGEQPRPPQLKAQ